MQPVSIISPIERSTQKRTSHYQDMQPISLMSQGAKSHAADPSGKQASPYPRASDSTEVGRSQTQSKTYQH